MKETATKAETDNDITQESNKSGNILKKSNLLLLLRILRKCKEKVAIQRLFEEREILLTGNNNKLIIRYGNNIQLNNSQSLIWKP